MSIFGLFVLYSNNNYLVLGYGMSKMLPIVEDEKNIKKEHFIVTYFILSRLLLYRQNFIIN